MNKIYLTYFESGRTFIIVIIMQGNKEVSRLSFPANFAKKIILEQ